MLVDTLSDRFASGLVKGDHSPAQLEAEVGAAARAAMERQQRIRARALAALAIRRAQTMREERHG